MCGEFSKRATLRNPSFTKDLSTQDYIILYNFQGKYNIL